MCDACRLGAKSAHTGEQERRPAAGAPAVHPLLPLQRAAGNRAVTRVLARDPPDRRPNPFIPRSPTLDIAAEQMQQAGATHVSPLTSHEREIGEQVYGRSIDLDRVRIATIRPGWLLAAPTTLGNTIRVKDPMDDNTLVHELMHVWQYQTAGLEYISCSLAAQAQGAVAHGDRNWAYDVDVPGPQSRLGDYQPEQQAMLIENAFRLGRLDDMRTYGAIVAQVRRARPLLGGAGAARDRRAGLAGPRRIDPLGPLAPDPRSEEMGGTVPQLEWRF